MIKNQFYLQILLCIISYNHHQKSTTRKKGCFSFKFYLHFNNMVFQHWNIDHKRFCSSIAFFWYLEKNQKFPSSCMPYNVTTHLQLYRHADRKPHKQLTESMLLYSQILEIISHKLYQFRFTAQKMKFSIKNFFGKCDQIRRFLGIWPHLLKKSLMENFTLCAE